MKPSFFRPARILAVGLVAAGATISSAAPSAFASDGISSTIVTSSERPNGGVSTFGDALAEPGRTTTFYRDTLWQLTVPVGSTAQATDEGGIQFVDARGTVTAGYAPVPMVDAAGVDHAITWTLDGTTLHQHVDIPTNSARGLLKPGPNAQSRKGYWDCVGDNGKNGMVGGAVSGCVVGAETGCAPGAAVGGFAGGLGGAVTGLFKC